MLATSATGEQGFTLLELLVVLTIVALLACAWPLASSRFVASQRLRNELQRLAAAIREAQMTARLTGTVQTLDVPANGISYTLGSEARALPDGMTIRLRPMYGNSPSYHFTLFPNGSATGGSVDLAWASRSASLRIEPVTGHLELQP